MMRISTTQLWVHDQDEALAFWTDKVGMEVREDVTMPEMGNFRWLTVGPPGQDDIAVVLMAIPGPPMMDEATAQQLADLMGKGWAGTMFLTTDDVRAERPAERRRCGVHRDARGTSLRHRRGVPRPLGQQHPPDPADRHTRRLRTGSDGRTRRAIPTSATN